MDDSGDLFVPGADGDRETWFGLPHTLEWAEIDGQGRLALPDANGVVTVEPI